MNGKVLITFILFRETKIIDTVFFFIINCELQIYSVASPPVGSTFPLIRVCSLTLCRIHICFSG